MAELRDILLSELHLFDDEAAPRVLLQGPPVE
jgi:hypothetical protein